jgi:hypothetical protein
LRPLRPNADWIAAEADRSTAAELQAFYEANSDYYHTAGDGEAAGG